MNKHDIVVGLQYGDEGKGKVVRELLSKQFYSHCIRFNGGPNAGHTIYQKEKKLVLHQIPIGILFGMKCILGPCCVINIEKLKNEINYLKENDVIIDQKKFYISYNSHIILEKYIENDKNNDKVGTTGNGIAQTYSQKMLRDGKRAIDFKEELNDMGIELIDCYEECRTANRILFEGAQGFGLDIDFGDYPYVTSSTCTIGGIVSCGINFSQIDNIYGVAKPYETYVGSKEFQQEDNEDMKQLQIIGEEYGATTGRKRQCNWLNINNLEKAINCNGCTHVIFNKCDIIKQINNFKVKITNEKVKEIEFEDSEDMLKEIKNYILNNCPTIKKVLMSYSANII